jgi:hypothetical protein
MTEVSFTGDLNYVTYLIEKYRQRGYVLVAEPEREPQTANSYKAVMLLPEGPEKPPYDVAILKDGQWVSCLSNFTFELMMKEEKPLAEQLTEAVEREDYETAAILRDKINKKQ